MSRRRSVGRYWQRQQRPVARRLLLYLDAGGSSGKPFAEVGCMEMMGMASEPVNRRRGLWKPRAHWICLRTEVRPS